jgi:tetratricopeptide (TPR) repeat protein
MGGFRALAVMLLCVWLLTPKLGFAQVAHGFSLTGTVYTDGSHERVENATVELCDEQGNRMEETRTNQSGEFFFRGIRPDNYVLRVHADGFETLELRQDLSMASERGLTVNLKSIPKGTAVPDRPTVSVHELSMPEAARELMTSGRKKLYQDNNAQGALRDFQAATKKAPNYYEAYYQAGIACLTMQQESEAQHQFRKSIEISQKKYGEAAIALGTLLLQHEGANEGESYLRQGLALNPASWPGQFELGKLELSRGHLETALTAAEKAESLAPQQPIVYRLLAIIHIKEKDYAGALTALDNYIRLDPDSPAGLRAKELRAETERKLPRGEATAVVSGGNQ